MVTIEITEGYRLSRVLGLWVAEFDGKRKIFFTDRGAAEHLVGFIQERDGKE